MKILLQTNNRKESQLSHEFNKLNESGFEVIPFGYIVSKPDSKEGWFGIPPPVITLTGLEDLKPSDEIITRSCIPLTKLIKCDRLETSIDKNIPSFSSTIQYDSKDFDIRNIPTSDFFLNKKKDNWNVTSIINILDYSYKHLVFIKPLNDLKLFSGTLVPIGKTLREVLIEKNELKLIKNFLELVLISKYCPVIEEEIRCYAVNKRVVTLSRYRFEDRLDFERKLEFNDPHSRKIKGFAQHVIDTVYCPCDNFTIDIARLDTKELKVIEYNCLTTSGLYEANTKDLFTALKGYYYD
jgi:hypothetical protein